MGHLIDVRGFPELIENACRLAPFLEAPTARLVWDIRQFFEEHGRISEAQYNCVVSILMAEGKVDGFKLPSELTPMQGQISKNVTKEVCPRCGQFRLATVNASGGSVKTKEVTICVGCGYFRILYVEGSKEEGVAFLVECPSCKRCQTWIRYPLSIFREHKDVRRILYWTCDKCKAQHSVQATLVDPTNHGNWYQHLIADARIVKG